MTDRIASLQAPRRFYKTVTVLPTPAGFAIHLDGRGARTPGGKPMKLPTAALADLVAEEWRGQGETIAYPSMPATRLAHTTLDGVAGLRTETIDSVVRYVGADLLCYFAEGPASLVARQKATWRPLIDWARRDLGLHFQTVSGIVHRQQDAETLRAVAARLDRADDFTLAAIAFAAALFGSATLALAMAEGRIDAAAAVAAGRLDDLFQEERWGVDVETIGRTEAIIGEAMMLERWFRSLQTSLPPFFTGEATRVSER